MLCVNSIRVCFLYVDETFELPVRSAGNDSSSQSSNGTPASRCLVCIVIVCHFQQAASLAERNNRLAHSLVIEICDGTDKRIRNAWQSPV